MMYEHRIGGNLLDNEEEYLKYTKCFQAVFRIFNNWTYRTGMPCEGIGGTVFTTFLKYVSDNTEEFGIEESKLYRFDVICKLFPEQMSLKEIAQYLERVEVCIGLSKGIISGFAYRIDAQLVTDAFRDALHCLEGLNLKRGKESGMFFDALLAVIENSGFSKQGAMVASSMEMSKYMSALLDLQPGMTVADLAAGVGVLLNVATYGLDVEVFAQEIQDGIASLNAMIGVMSGCRRYHVARADSLNEKVFVPAGGFDRIICEPPILQKLSARQTLKWGTTVDGTWAFIMHIIEQLKVGGRAVVLLPQAYGFRSGVGSRNRQWLIENGYLDAVVDVPGEANVYTRARYDIWVLKKPGIREVSDVYMLDLTDEKYQPIEWHECAGDELLEGVFKGRLVVDGVSAKVSVHELEQNGWLLSLSRYIDKAMDLEQFLSDGAALYDREAEIEGELRSLSEEIKEQLQYCSNLT